MNVIRQIIEKIAYVGVPQKTPIPDDLPNFGGVPCLKYDHKNNKSIVVFCHGNATSIDQLQQMACLLSTSLQCCVVVPEIPGIQYNWGRMCLNTYATENMHVKSVETVCLNLRKTYLPEKLLIIGHSIGSVSACYVATTGIVDGLILLSPIASVTLLYLPFRIPFFDIFGNIDIARDILCKTVIFHGSKDCDIPMNHGKWLHELISDSEFIECYNCNHSNLLFDQWEKIINKIRQWNN